ncbi:Bug family tripartite tricarboxylate transporter substrate binding protein [Ramlibacter rhizophilus]|uniref:Tripartite tricarboxylate transporter substrate binding protein n=1 Tax=Ramlibacter rhizophilus TaxID=1781167 RepID=A0A4Z0BN30_9BURK|nr:tripartite tricarboxylate transporter substrate binding protein [Ramlibacter rhizophilus]TFY99823.1 tripartite tricarboxylate transporter substrate binding protein [Ramlibacter rhizophilus]
MGTRRHILLSSALVAAALAAGHPALAQGAGDYPSRPIKFYAGFPPGGVADIVARIVAQPLGDRLGQPVVVDNRSGAGGAIGVDAVAKSPPDGYTMGFGVSGALTSSVTLNPKLPYDPRKDIEPVSTVVMNPLVLVVPTASGIKDMKSFIAAAKASPTPFNYGTPGPGTAMNLAGELLKEQTGIRMDHVAYKGSSPAATDLLGGHLKAAMIDYTTAKPHIQSGRLTALGQTGSERSSVVPDVPTIAEAGVPGYEFNSWFGLVMPAGTPKPILDKVHTALDAVLRDPAVRKQLVEAGSDPAPSTPAAMRQRIDREIAMTSKLIKDAGISLQR